MWRVPHLFCKNVAGTSLVWLASTTAGFAFILFGYDQGVMGGLITLPSFLDVFPEVRDADVSGITVAIYEIGCLMGAITAIFVGDKLGRKNTIFYGMAIMIIGAVIKTASYGLPEFIVGRIIMGVGNGMNTATVPALQSELAPPQIRGSLILISGALIAAGIAVSYIINLAFYFLDSSASWRVPIAFQCVFAIAVMVMLFAIPESPAWLVKHSDKHPEYLEEGKTTLAKIYKTEKDDPTVLGQIDAIKATSAEVAAFSFKDLFTNGPSQNFRRASLGFLAQAFQQLTGCNIVTYYATTLFENSIGLSPLLSRILSIALGIFYALVAFATTTFVDRLGRRSTMLWGAVGCSLCMVLLCALVYTSDNSGNKGAAYAATVFIFGFEAVFAYGWLGQTWLYPAELTSLPIRSQATGISTCSNWLFNFLVVMVTPPGFDSIGAYTYLIFGAINAVIIFPGVYFLFPETTRRSLEEIDLIFAEVYNDKDGELGGYVKHSLTRPRIHGRELDVELQAQLALAKSGARTEHIEVAVDAADGRPAGVMRRFLGGKKSGGNGRNGGAALRPSSTHSSGDTAVSQREKDELEKANGEVVMRDLA
ncbi:hypothetical protein JCM10207_009036 [Rhodosporidiobolus poonsookiae]